MPSLLKRDARSIVSGPFETSTEALTAATVYFDRAMQFWILGGRHSSAIRYGMAPVEGSHQPFWTHLRPDTITILLGEKNCVRGVFNIGYTANPPLKTAYSPVVVCSRHPRYFYFVHDRRANAPPLICPECFAICRNCSARFPVGQNPLCSRCGGAGVAFCQEHGQAYATQSGCRGCRRASNDWRSLKAEPTDIEQVTKLIKSSRSLRTSVNPKETLYLPMARRFNDPGIQEIIQSVGGLPVQICLMGISSGNPITVSRDIRLPEHPLTSVVVVDPYAHSEHPMTIFLNRKAREEPLLGDVIKWLKCFK